MPELLNWDQTLFHLINIEWQNGFCDWLMPLLRNKFTWMPMYIFLVSFLVLNYKRKGLLLVILLCLSVGISDLLSSQLIKKTVQRERPCHVFEAPSDIQLLVNCGSGYSFPSSHAANHFTIAVLLSLILGPLYRWIKIPLLLWAASISFAQVYVGVHFPLDILAGAIIGSLIGFLGSQFFNNGKWFS